MSVEVDLAITGMTCASCVARVEKKLRKLPGVEVAVNLATEQAHLVLAEPLPTEELIGVVEKAGYGAALLQRSDEIPDDGEAGEHATPTAYQDSTPARIADLKKRFIVSAIFSVPVVALSMITALQFDGWQWLITLLSIPVVTWGAWPFHRAAFAAARHAASTMDTLVSLGIVASVAWSLYALAFGGAGEPTYRMVMFGVHGVTHTHLYWESAAMITTFLLLGRWLEARSRRSAGNALRALLAMGAQTAWRIDPSSGAEEEIPAEAIHTGDLLKVRPGEKIPTDAVIIDGESAIDASLVTGESIPVDVSPGDQVIGGTVNTWGALTVRATAVGSETMLATMGRLLTEAQTSKAPIQRIADRISAVFVPGVILISLATLIVRLLIVGDSMDVALASAISALVVACPCALGLATPTALLVGSSAASRKGILLRGADVLESAHRTDVIVFDKTGTLTTGQMNVEASSDETLALAAAGEVHSEHPIARAIVRAARERSLDIPATTNFMNHPGGGVTAELGAGAAGAAGATLIIGSPEFLTSQGVELNESQIAATRSSGAGLVCVALSSAAETSPAEVSPAATSADSPRLVGTLAVRDSVREEARGVVNSLKNSGIMPVLLTGDHADAAAQIAGELGITEVHAHASPQKKLEVVTALQAAGHTVAMVGDGVNDAAALAAADLSLAMGSGTDVAKAAADITIVNSSMESIPRALEISRATLRTIKENLAWAFSYNLIAIPAAVAGFILPGLAGAAMASSSVIVVLNSLRLRRHRSTR